jgi:predicted thioesterase
MDFPSIAAALTIIATIVGSTVRVMMKLNQMDRELLSLRMEFQQHNERIARIERKVGL